MSAVRRYPTRRDLITGGASALAVGAFLPIGPATALQMDRDLIDLLYAQEQALIVHYAATLEAFDESAFRESGFPPDVRTGLEEILAAEEAHQILVTRPDRTPITGFDPVIPENVHAALREAAALENLAVATYAFVIPELGRERLIPELLGIHSVEARHAAWLATLLGEEPFPDAIDPPLTLDEPDADTDEPSATPTVTDPPAAEAGSEPIVAAVAQALNVAADELEVVSITPETWPDASLGCPEPDMLYAQVVTPGYVVVVEVAEEEIELHTDEQGNVVRCP